MVSSRASRQLSPADAYDLSEAWERGALRVSRREVLHSPFEIGRGEERPTRPIVFVRSEGLTPRDVIGTTYATLTLVSEHLLHVLRGHGFSGWTTFPIEILFGNNQRLIGYEGLAVTGRCGGIDDRLSQKIVLDAPATPGGRSRPGLRGLCFSSETWDGSDVFTSDDRASIFVVERLKVALVDAGVTNVQFRRLSEVERPDLGSG